DDAGAGEREGAPRQDVSDRMGEDDGREGRRRVEGLKCSPETDDVAGPVDAPADKGDPRPAPLARELKEDVDRFERRAELAPPALAADEALAVADTEVCGHCADRHQRGPRNRE